LTWQLESDTGIHLQASTHSRAKIGGEKISLGDFACAQEQKSEEL
jgi:hypothetical protein